MYLSTGQIFKRVGVTNSKNAGHKIFPSKVYFCPTHSVFLATACISAQNNTFPKSQRITTIFIDSI